MLAYLHDNELFLLHKYKPYLLSERLLPSSQTWKFSDGHFTCCTNTLILYTCSIIQYICSTYFLFFCVFFLAPNRPQKLGEEGFVSTTRIKNGILLKHWQTSFCKRINTKSQPAKKTSHTQKNWQTRICTTHEKITREKIVSKWEFY